MSIIGAGVTDIGLQGSIAALLALFGTLFGILVNALLKTGTRQDEITRQIVEEKDAELQRVERRHQEEIGSLRSDLTEMRAERDLWFKKYDDARHEGST